MDSYFLGVDGGQSSTTGLIADASGAILGAGHAGPCNHVGADEAVAKFRRVIGGCVQDACLAAGLDAKTTFRAACFGFSGGPHDKEALTREMVPSQRYRFTHDGEIALSGAFAGGPGIVVIAGTGSIVFGRNGKGETARAGGWGYVFGDEGSAFDLVRLALRAALQMEEGWGKETKLHRALLEAAHTASANELLHRFYTSAWPRSRIAALALLVTGAAEAGDEVAGGILKQCAAGLTSYIAGVHGKLFADDRASVAPIGGPFQSSALRNELAWSVKERTGCTLVEPRMQPAHGAVMEAMKLV